MHNNLYKQPHMIVINNTPKSDIVKFPEIAQIEVDCVISCCHKMIV